MKADDEQPKSQYCTLVLQGFFLVLLKSTLPPPYTRGSVCRFGALEVLAAESCVTFPLQGGSSSACAAKPLLGTGQPEARRPWENKPANKSQCPVESIVQ